MYCVGLLPQKATYVLGTKVLKDGWESYGGEESSCREEKYRQIGQPVPVVPHLSLPTKFPSPGSDFLHRPNQFSTRAVATRKKTDTTPTPTNTATMRPILLSGHVSDPASLDFVRSVLITPARNAP